jgi:hypothetical protein
VAVTSELAVITPSYALDFELCTELNASVLSHTPDSVAHYIITPRRDLKIFGRLKGPRTEVWSVDELLPRRVVAVPNTNYWVNLRHPAPPIRGWVMQQVVKLAAAARIDAELLLLADSDVLFVRSVTADTFRLDGRLRFYRKDAAVDEHFPRHLIWHKVARALLGLPEDHPPLPDYISPLNIWDRQTMLDLQERIEQVTGRHWLDAVAAQLHFSEFILYGVFVDNFADASSLVGASDSMLCHSYWGHNPLSVAETEKFIGVMPPEDVAIMISAKSYTSIDVRREALSGYY